MGISLSLSLCPVWGGGNRRDCRRLCRCRDVRQRGHFSANRLYIALMFAAGRDDHFYVRARPTFCQPVEQPAERGVMMPGRQTQRVYILIIEGGVMVIE